MLPPKQSLGRPLIASTRERTRVQNMFSRDVKGLSFRCQTLKFSHPNVKCSA